MLFDSHVHLSSPRFADDLDAVLKRAQSAGVARLLSCATDLKTSAAELQIARRSTGVVVAVGIHPHEARVVARGDPCSFEIDERSIDHLRHLAMESKVVAIGEIGLDYHYDFSPRAVQRAVFYRQLQMAQELELPVVIHSREADQDMIQVLTRFLEPLRGVMHCFLGERELLDVALDRGLYVGVAGPVTFRRMEDLHRLLRRVPIDRLLIETDAPFLAPHPYRGKRNEPAWVRYVAEELSRVLGLSTDKVERQTFANACRLFRVQ